MDPSTIIGLFLAFGSVVAMVTLEDANLMALLLPAPMVLVFGATLAVGLAGNTFRDTVRAFKDLPKAFKGKTDKPQDSIDQLSSLAEKARSSGLAQEIGPLNPYERRIVHMAVSEVESVSSESIGDAFEKTVIISVK